MTIHTQRHSPARGFSMAELIVVVVIITTLVLIMTPVLMRRASEGRVATARKDMQHLADALERAHIHTNYIFRLDALNDGPRRDGMANTDPASTIQGISDVGVVQNNLYGPEGHHIFISLDTQSFAPNQSELYARLARNETAFGWQGPYINWHRDLNRNDWPDDPWGNDYLLFTFNGVIYPPVGEPLMEQSQGWRFLTWGPYYRISGPGGNLQEHRFEAANIFDRPTLLSLGPNGLPGDGTIGSRYGEGDDIIYQFGGH